MNEVMEVLQVPYSDTPATFNEVTALMARLGHPFVPNRDENDFERALVQCTGRMTHLVNEETRSEHISSEDEWKNHLRRLAHAAECLGKSYPALRALRLLGEQDTLLDFAWRCMEHPGSRYNAWCAFTDCGCREGMYQAMLLVRDSFALGNSSFASYFDSYFGQSSLRRFREALGEWAKQLRCETRPSAPDLADCIAIAPWLANKYDVGIGIANSGLSSAFIFGKFGLAIRAVDAHRSGDSASFRWMNGMNGDNLKGKRVLLFDKDVDTGRTTRRVVDELQQLGVAEIDLFLRHSPDRGHTRVDNVPPEIGKLFYPTMFPIAGLDKAVSQFEASLWQEP